ncbi:MAG: VOC family protein [Gammaproteobacteria bacterium]
MQSSRAACTSTLLTHEKVRQFTKKEIADAHKTTEVLTALVLESKAKMHELADKAIKAGAKQPRPPQDYGFMFARSFEDPDGHIWEVFWMDPAHVQKG